MTARLFQYAKTNDAATVEAVETNHQRMHEFQRDACAWAAKITGNPEASPIVWTAGIRRRVSGIPEVYGQDPAQHGGMNRSTAPDGWTYENKGGWRPKKKHPDYAGMDAIKLVPTEVPGLVEIYETEGFILWTVPFVHDGWAWHGLSKPPQKPELGPMWSEVLPSAYVAAETAWKAANR